MMKIIASLSLMLLLVACSGQNQFYKAEDFEKVKKIDSHVHLRNEHGLFAQCAIKDNFRLVTIMIDRSNSQNAVQGQKKNALSQKNRHPEAIEFFTCFSMEGWDEEEWVDNTIASIDSSINEGAAGVKIWRNIGMT